MWLSRDSYRNPPRADLTTLDIHEKIVEIVPVHHRFGYRRYHDLLLPQCPEVDHKRGSRLYRQANLAPQSLGMLATKLICAIPLRLFSPLYEFCCTFRHSPGRRLGRNAASF